MEKKKAKAPAQKVLNKKAPTSMKGKKGQMCK